MFRIILAAAVALLPLQIADAACYPDGNGGWVCDAPARTTVRRGPLGRVYARTVQAAPVASARYSTGQVYSSGGSSGYSATYSGGSTGGTFAHWGPMTTAERATSARYGTAQESAAVVDAPAAGSAACCEKCAELERRIEMLEANQYAKPAQTSHTGPPVSVSGHAGPTVVLTSHRGPSVVLGPPSEPAKVVAMR